MQPTALSPALLGRLPRALEACESAITLRARVAEFLAEAADETHAHFLSRLKTWFTTLRAAFPAPHEPAPRKQQAKKKKKSTKKKKKTTPQDEQREELPLDFSNYYSVLALPDDYFPNDEALVEEDTPSAPSQARPLPAAEQKRLVDEAFAQDLNAEVASLLMELEELSEGVYSAFHGVKLEKTTLIEATAVAKVAIGSASSVIAKLQLRYPTIREADALAGFIRDRLTLLELDRLEARVTAAWHHDDDEDEDNTKYRYAPGTVLMDALWLAPILSAFGNQNRARPGTRFQASTDIYGERYSEEDSPLYSMPVVRAGATFISQQLPASHQFMLEVIEKNLVHTDFAAIWLLDLFEEFSSSGHVSIQLLFVCICWFRSVAALEGNRGLGRTISLSIMHHWDLADRLGSSIEQAGACFIDPPSLKSWRDLLDNIQSFDDCTGLLRLNPLLAGCFLTYHQVKYLSTGHDTVVMNSRFKAFCHLYSALRDRQLLEEIPFLEGTIHVYESAIFPSPRSQVTQGSFEQSFMTSKKQVETSINASSNRRSSRNSDSMIPAWLRFRLENFSHAGKILFANDYSAVSTGSMSYVSWTSLLNAVSAQFSKEIFDSRVLSRDLLKLSDDLTDLFFALRDELCRGDAYEDILQGPFHSEIQATTTAVESCVMFPLLSLLDSLDLDGRVRLVPDISDLEEFQRGRMRGRSSASEVVLGYCKHAANVLARKFGGGPAQIENLYFTLPSTAAWASIVFGEAHAQSTTSHLSKRMANPRSFLQSHRSEAQIMDYLLDLMKNSRGPLHGEALADFKNCVITHPGLLYMSSFDRSIELPSLLHCTAAGPAHDKRLVEWLIQMGALAVESPHCRFPAMLQGAHQDTFSNMLAVHCAAQNGYDDIVKLLLEAGNFRDLNTPTYRTKESLVHIAVKANNRELFDWLVAKAADLSQKDASGRRVWSLTSDPLFKAHITRLNDQQSSQRNRLQARIDRSDGGYRVPPPNTPWKSIHIEIGADVELEDLPDFPLANGIEPISSIAPSQPTSIESASDIARSGVSTHSNGNDVGDSAKKKKKTKKKRKKKGSSQQVAEESNEVDTTANLIQQLLVSDRSELLGNKVAQLEEALNTLKQRASVSQQQLQISASIALKILDEIESVMQRAPMLRNATKIRTLDSELLSAARTVFLLDEYSQQLSSNVSQLNSLTRELTNEEKLNRKAGSCQDVDTFYLFMMFAICVASSLYVCGHKSRAEDIFRLIEQRLLEIQYRGDVIEEYVEIRKMLNVTPALGTTHEAQHHFEWYASDHGFGNSGFLPKLDRLHGANVYAVVSVTSGFTSEPGVRCKQLIEDSVSHGRDVIFLNEFAFTGADTREQNSQFMAASLRATHVTGLQVNMRESGLNLLELPLFNFIFSSTGIVPNDHSNCRYCTH